MKWRAGPIVVASVALSCLAMAAHAAAPVAEIAGAPGVSQGVVKTSPQPAATSASTQTYYLLQSLRDELRVLRGMVEEQGNTIRLLKQRQVDDYLDLDRRLGGLTAGAVSAQGALPAGSSATNSPASSTAMAVAKPANDAEKAAYEKAYGVLKAGQMAAAKQAFIAYLGKYPRGRYAANGHYWLGEIYMLDNQLQEASEAFAVVVAQYPAHRKMLDASFKLGKVYHLQGKNEKAKALLGKVAATKGSAGKLAGDYLKANF
ncbi:MAG: tetratricopeptide repeat protein [Gammaproteobacteria bacterium]|nr:tetratricopeptide repeat protein [Gammaproteobacteria bacterium]MBQ0840711.1 tetratricopeptide repeat protein [Gammaproteobacteria bacterium]